MKISKKKNVESIVPGKRQLLPNLTSGGTGEEERQEALKRARRDVESRDMTEHAERYGIAMDFNRHMSLAQAEAVRWDWSVINQPEALNLRGMISQSAILNEWMQWLQKYLDIEGWKSRLIRATESVVTEAHDEKAIEPLWHNHLSDVDIVPSPFTIRAVKNLSRQCMGVSNC